MNWTEYPLIRPTIVFITGILISQIYALSLITLLCIFLALIFTLTFLRFQKKTILNTTLSSIGILGFYLMLGYSISLINSYNYQPHHFSHHTNTKDTLIVKLTEDSKIGNSIRSFGNVKQINRTKTQGKLLIYFKKDSISTSYKAGDIVAVVGKTNKVKQNTNPEAFDYSKYLASQNIHHQIYINEGQHRLIKSNQLTFPSQQAFEIRRWGIKTLRKALKNDDEFAIASALIFGERSNLSRELSTMYAETGAIHVLAVSGLHVGIITYIFLFLFKFIRSKTTAVKILKLVCLLCIVWSYALITGGAPAVMRAALMFSLIIIGKYWFTHWNTYNLLALSALILLCINPMYIYQVGFQFSYLALISIVFFYNLIYKRLVVNNKIVNYITGLASVSIAAQILVLPLSIFYFHKIPTYFILSGIFAVFLAPFILGLGLFTVAISKFIPIFKVCSYLLSGLLKLFIWGIESIHDLPFSSISNLWLYESEVVLLFISIIAFMLFIYKKHMMTTVVTIMLCGIMLLGSNIRRKATNHNYNKLTVYDTSKNKTFIEIYKEQASYIHSSENITTKDIDFLAKNHRIKHGITEFKTLSTQNGIFNFKDKVCYIPSRNHSLRIPKRSDYLFIINQYNKSPHYVFKHHHTQNVVIDNSINSYTLRKWRKYCSENKINLHIIKTDGAFTIE